MKKILFIMILATTFIPVPQTGASMGDINISDELKAKETQTIVKQVSDSVLDNKAQLIPGKIIKEESTRKSYISRQRLAKKSKPGDKRDRLFGLLLLAHGGQR